MVVESPELLIVLHLSATLIFMPTKRPRITITETSVVARRLKLAATRFPDRAESRGDLLLALTEVAEMTLMTEQSGDTRRASAKKRLLERTRSITPTAAQAMLSARDQDWQHTADW